jgi:Na+/proline symporter
MEEGSIRFCQIEARERLLRRRRPDHWGVNGIAFAGDYLSAASFLGICGMIATVGYDGFLYSIGYLAGWIVALFVVAEPMKRLGKYTFTDAVDSSTTRAASSWPRPSARWSCRSAT